MKVGDTVQINDDNSYFLDPQTAVVQSFHTENGWEESHGWIWLMVDGRQLLFWPSEYEVLEIV